MAEYSTKAKEKLDELRKKGVKYNEPEYRRAYEQFEFEKCNNWAFSLNDLFSFLKEKGWKHIVMWYEGAGDSGDAYEAEGYKDDSGSLNNYNPDANYAEYIEKSKWIDDKRVDLT